MSVQGCCWGRGALCSRWYRDVPSAGVKSGRCPRGGQRRGRRIWWYHTCSRSRVVRVSQRLRGLTGTKASAQATGSHEGSQGSQQLGNSQTSDAGRLASQSLQQQPNVKKRGATRSREGHQATLLHVRELSSHSPRPPLPKGVTRRLDVIIVIGSNKEMHLYQRPDKNPCAVWQS